MYSDLDRYMSGSFSWSAIDKEGFEMLKERWGVRKVKAVFREKGIDVEDDDEG
jgi:hypothetical protein